MKGVNINLKFIYFIICFNLLQSNYLDLLIDPGHGGYDPGNLGWLNNFYNVNYYPSEDDINLDISLLINSAIDPEIWSDFTRHSDDIFLSTHDRARIANGLMQNQDGEIAKYGFSVSIHQNSNSDPHFNYFRMFYSDDWHWNPGGTQFNHELKRSKSEELASFITDELGPIIYSDLFPIWTDFTGFVEFNDSTISNFIDGTHCPTILIECGFLSNENYYEYITENILFQYSMAIGISEGIDDYYSNNPLSYIQGDANNDNILDVSDIVIIINHLLVGSCNTSFNGTHCLLNSNFFLADYNNDNIIDVTDVIGIVNQLLNFSINTEDIASNIFISHTLEEDEHPFYFLDTYMLNDGVIQGISLEINLPDGFETVGIEKSIHAGNMTLKSNPAYQNDSQKVKKIIYSPEGEYIDSGNGQITRIKIKQNDGLNRIPITEIIQKVNNIETIIGSGNYELEFSLVDFDTYLQSIESNEYIQISEQFSLSNVFPNPFNPTTSIHYDLPIESHISIIIYNLNGNQIEKLINKNQYAGTYQIEWNANQYASGTYFVKLKASSSESREIKYTNVKKITLIK